MIVSSQARQLLMRGLIECLPDGRQWTLADREEWLRLLHFLIEWLFEILEEGS